MTRVIAICGLKRSGKDTVAEMILRHGTSSKEPGYEIRHIATRLKEVVKLLFDFSNEQMMGNEKDILDERWNITPRRAMQYFGTEMVQHHMSKLLLNDRGKYFWIDNLTSQINGSNKIQVIPDLRFLHEYDTLNTLYKGKLTIIRVIREKMYASDDISNTHISESEYFNIPPNIIIKNDGTLDDLDQYVEKLCKNRFIT